MWTDNFEHGKFLKVDTYNGMEGVYSNPVMIVNSLKVYLKV